MKPRHIQNYIFTSLTLAALFGLIACGSSGGGGSSTLTAEGVFKDSNVSGMNYTSGAQSGTTGPDGGFTYEVGKAVTFSVGGVTVGSTAGKSVVTPVDLVAAGSSDSIQVQNIVRFLLMLDKDGFADNSIVISPAVQAISSSWAQVDFTTSDLVTALASIITDAINEDGTAHILPNSFTAQAHLESTLLCTRAGAYRGTFSGDDSGPFGVLIDAKTGLLSGFAFANMDQELLSLTGSTAISFDQSANFISGDVSSGATFTGQFSGPDTLGGSWALSPDSGTFSGSRIGGANNAAFRFTGRFSGSAFGLFTFDVDATDDITGLAYTVYAPADGTTDELASFSGSVSGSSLQATITDGGIVDATITGTLDKTTGSLTGSWLDADGNSGSFTGSGCNLNPALAVAG